MIDRAKRARRSHAGCTPRSLVGAMWFASLAVLQSSCVPVGNNTTTSAPPGIARSVLLDCATALARLVCVGERGAIALSDDNGTHWRRAQAPLARLLTAVHFADASRGWAVGHDGIILHSADGGATWRVQFRLADETVPLFDVAFNSNNQGIAVGAFGHYVTTDDAGATWTERRMLASDFHLYAVTSAPNAQWWVAGEAGTLLRSSDNGASWQSMTLPFTSSVFGLVAESADTLLVYGLLGAWANSYDGGGTWHVGQLPTRASLQAADISERSAPLLASADGTVWRSDGAPLAHYAGAIAHLRRLSDGNILVSGTSGVKRLALDATPNATSFAR